MTISENQAAAEQTTTIPFEVRNNKIVLSVSVNNIGPLSFVLDTGAANSLVSLDKVEQLKLKTLSKIPVAGAGNSEVFGYIVEPVQIQVSGLKTATFPVQVAFPLAELSKFEGSRVDGILGYEFFSNFVVEIDYHLKRLRLYPKDRFAYTGAGSRIPLEFRNNHPHFKGSIQVSTGENIDADFILDTGSGLSLAVTKTFAEKHNLLPKLQTKIKTPTGLGVAGVTHGFVGRLKSLKLGGYSIDNPIITLMMDGKGVFATSEYFEGNVGGDLMKKFRVFLDYERKQMILEKNESFLEKQTYDASGLFLSQEANGITVVGVADNSPAIEAKIEVGDVILEVDGRQASTLRLERIRERFMVPKPAKLKIRRGEKQLNVNLSLRVLV